ncbi:FAD-binding and (Fe-S)-binding domain-containing protein [Streptomyces sp. AK02-01A]|uniref:FAD-binding and (Fe-S)-binding domain-containing protein n=1 Tax=Streptomyces sp. AK02-01A TaxID=3028648 RepID=UPI0029BD44E9|nr:FAD-binding and (Fe-S)-binding domain-containing protein [Streptomyces sp. AK02-01A]MDX3854647.1 FAD-binding and (Fe-S)-binding domain-containing protein [Streptomyces sp. AK02-01A]
MAERETKAAATALATALKAAVRGEVDFGAAARALTTMDASNYRRVPVGVVAPRDAADVAAAMAVCREHGVPVLPRGAGTSIAGQATGVGVVLDLTRHLRSVLSVDARARTAVVQPGVVLDDLRDAVRPHGLTFGPDPSTHNRCTLGGMIGNNSCGAHSVAWGTTADNVRELSVTTYGGAALRLGQGWDGAPAGLRELVGRDLALLRTGFPAGLPRRISGYALDALLPEAGTDLARAFCGSEGTLGVVTEATVRLVESPPARALAVLGYPDESAAAEAAAGLLSYGPLTVEGMAEDLVPAGHRLPRGGAWLFVETGGASSAEARAAAERIVRAADALDGTVVADPAGQRALWRVREDAAGTATRMPDGSEAWPGWEDCAVPPARLGAYLRDFRALLAQHELRGTPYGHFGDGCIHVRIDFDLLSEAGVRRFRRFSEETAELVVAHGGSLSGEHGDGLARAELLPKMYGDELVALFGRFKDLWDPAGGMNPGALARPARLDENLRFAVLPRERVDVAFGYPHDGPAGGDFSAAVRRCVGVAKCRVAGPGSGADVMCPSYRATGEEQHSTRGRARLLHEMLAGEIVTDGWRSAEVKDALDLCLSCKGCRGDCPVGVDMATYKAEFLHHHYAGRLRPAEHYAMGWLPVWLRAAAPFAGVLNAAARLKPSAALAKRLAGIAPERTIPRLAPETFGQWLRRHLGNRTGVFQQGRSAVLWPDTFTEHLSPSVGQAAVRVMEAAGIGIVAPPAGRAGRLCCGLTYVSTGQLDRARTVMRRTLDRMEPLLDLGLPVVVLEPSCAAALTTDLPELLGDDPRAARLAASVRTFAQTLEECAPDWRPPRLDRPVAGQTHCHQHAVLGDAADRRLRERAGLTGELSGGCCGLAGNFGFERGHYDVSVACAEDQLLPSVRAAVRGPVPAELLADGFSCRTQLDQLGGHRARHLAEVLAEGLTDGPEEEPADGPAGRREKH